MKKLKYLFFILSVFAFTSCGNMIGELSAKKNSQQNTSQQPAVTEENPDIPDTPDTQPQPNQDEPELPAEKQKFIVSYSSMYGTVPPAFIADEGYIITIKDLPELTVAGYIFDGWYIGETKVIPDTYIVTQNIVITAKWLTGNPTYKVRHYCNSLTYENILVDEELLDGPAGSYTNAQAKEYYGFYANNFSQSKINANNTTVVNIYYYRNTYTITLNLGRDFGIDSVSGLYESSVNYSNPTRPNLIFSGWNVPGGKLPQKFTKNETYTAVWTEQGSNFGLYIISDDNSEIDITTVIENDTLFIMAESGLSSYLWKIDQMAPNGITEIVNSSEPNTLVITDYTSRTTGVYCISVTAIKNNLEYSGRIYIKKE